MLGKRHYSCRRSGCHVVRQPDYLRTYNVGLEKPQPDLRTTNLLEGDRLSRGAAVAAGAAYGSRGRAGNRLRSHDLRLAGGVDQRRADDNRGHCAPVVVDQRAC